MTHLNPWPEKGGLYITRTAADQTSGFSFVFYVGYLRHQRRYVVEALRPLANGRVIKWKDTWDYSEWVRMFKRVR